MQRSERSFIKKFCLGVPNIELAKKICLMFIVSVNERKAMAILKTINCP